MSVEEALSHVEQTLDIPQRDVLAAAKIAPRTFYHWRRKKDVVPRLSSLGRAMALIQTCEDLGEILGAELQRWFKTDPQRRKQLRAGEFDQLIADALAERSRRESLRRPPMSFFESEHAVGVDNPGPRVAQPKTLKGRVVVRRAGGLSGRIGPDQRSED